MSNEVLNSELPSSMRFDDLGVLEIDDPDLLASVAGGNSPVLGNNGACQGDGNCLGNTTCVGDGYCHANGQC